MVFDTFGFAGLVSILWLIVNIIYHYLNKQEKAIYAVGIAIFIQLTMINLYIVNIST